MMFFRELPNELQIYVTNSDEFNEDGDLFNRYMKGWEKGFNRQGYRERLKWLFKRKCEIAIVVDKNTEIIGAVNKHENQDKSFKLFNNLFSIEGKSTIPLAVPLIKTLLHEEEKTCIGYPNKNALIPYRRCGFKVLTNYKRGMVDINNIELVDQYNLYDVYRLSATDGDNLTNYQRWRYPGNLIDREYFVVSKNINLPLTSNFSIISIYKPEEKINILDLEYSNDSERNFIFCAIKKHALNINAKSIDFVANGDEDSFLSKTNGNSHPIIGYNYNSNQELVLRDGDNDVF